MQTKLVTTAAAPPILAIQTLPPRVRMPLAEDTFGISRSAIYRAAAAGRIKLTKLGRTTLVDTASVLEFLNSLPDYKSVAA